MPSQRWFFVGAVLVAGGCNCGRSGTLVSQVGIPQVAPSALNFGNVAVGQSRQQKVQLSNVGSGLLDIATQTVSGPPFAESVPLATSSLPAGTKSQAVVTFSPTSAGPFSGSLVFEGDGEPAGVRVSLAGVGLDLNVSATPASLSFGQVPVGLSPAPAQMVTLENMGSATSYVSVATASTAAEYAVTDSLGHPLTVSPVQLAPNVPYVLEVAFSPDAVSIFNSMFSFTVCEDATSNACLVPQTVTLSGQGVSGQLALTPNPIVFSGVPEGTSATQTITVSNVGGAAATVSCIFLQSLGPSACGSASSVFTLGSPSATLPTTVAAGGSFTLPLSYQSAGSTAQSDVLAVAYIPQGLTTSVTATDDIQASPSGSPCSLSLAPNTLSFAYTGVGVPVSQYLTIGNTGGTACQVTSLSIDPASDPSYALASGQPLSLTIAPNGSASIEVIFDLASGGPPSTRLGNLDFQSTDPAYSGVQVPLVAAILDSTGASTSGTATTTTSGSSTGNASGTTGGSTSGTTSGVYAGGGAWPRWHHDNIQSGRSASDTSWLTGTVVWTASVGVPGVNIWTGLPTDYENSPVVGSDGTIYQLGMNGTLYAFNSDGSVQWSTPLEGPINDPHPGTPAIAGDGSLFVAFGDTVQGGLPYGLFHVSSAGTILSAIPPSGGGDGFDLPPVLTNGGLLLGADDEAWDNGASPGAFAFQINADGTVNVVGSASINASSDQISAVVGADDSTYWCGGENCNALSPPTSGFGELTNWPAYPNLATNPAQTSDLALDQAFTGNLMILFGGGYDAPFQAPQQLVSLNPRTGQVAWTLLLPSPTAAQVAADQPQPGYLPTLADATMGNSCPAMGSDGTVYVGNFDGLHAVDGTTGLEKSGFPFLTNADDVLTAPAIGSDGTIFFGTAGGAFYAIHPDGTLRFKLTAGGRIAGSPAIGPTGAVYFTANDGYLYSVH